MRYEGKSQGVSNVRKSGFQSSTVSSFAEEENGLKEEEILVG